jgi:hypothetical protein
VVFFLEDSHSQRFTSKNKSLILHVFLL